MFLSFLGAQLELSFGKGCLLFTGKARNTVLYLIRVLNKLDPEMTGIKPGAKDNLQLQRPSL